jgi:hypothetical protein
MVPGLGQTANKPRMLPQIASQKNTKKHGVNLGRFLVGYQELPRFPSCGHWVTEHFQELKTLTLKKGCEWNHGTRHG